MIAQTVKQRIYDNVNNVYLACARYSYGSVSIRWTKDSNLAMMFDTKNSRSYAINLIIDSPDCVKMAHLTLEDVKFVAVNSAPIIPSVSKASRKKMWGKMDPRDVVKLRSSKVKSVK
jgi:hypothetical protein